MNELTFLEWISSGSGHRATCCPSGDEFSTALTPVVQSERVDLPFLGQQNAVSFAQGDAYYLHTFDIG